MSETKKQVGYINSTVTIRPLFLIGLLLLVGFTYFQFVGYIWPQIMKYYHLGTNLNRINHIGFIWVPIIGHILISGIVCLLVSTFKPLKSIKEDGLVKYIRNGFIYGTCYGLLGWFIFGNPISHTLGIISGFVYGIVIGLSDEFK